MLHNLCVPLVTRVLTVRSFYSLTGRALWLTLRLPTVATANRLTFTPFGRPWCCRARPAHQFTGENQRLSCEPGVGFGARRKQPCACTPNFAGFARLGSALGPGESPRERQPFGRARCLLVALARCSRHRAARVARARCVGSALRAPSGRSLSLTLITFATQRARFALSRSGGRLLTQPCMWGWRGSTIWGGDRREQPVRGCDRLWVGQTIGVLAHESASTRVARAGVSYLRTRCASGAARPEGAQHRNRLTCGAHDLLIHKWGRAAKQATWGPLGSRATSGCEAPIERFGA